MLEYLEDCETALNNHGLPEGAPRLQDLFETLWHVTEETRPFAKWASVYSCLAIVQRAFIRGCKLDEIPVIIGQGAEGKSAFVKFLLPAHIRALGFTENIAPNADSKTFGEQIIGRWVAEFSELINVSGGNLARIKANITATDDGTTCLCSDNRVQPAHMCAVWHRK